MRGRMLRRVGSGLAAAILLSGSLVMASGSAALAVEKTFVGYGYLPSDAHADAVSQMQAYSPSCRELNTVYSPAGSEHYWKATLTADC